MIDDKIMAAAANAQLRELIRILADISADLALIRKTLEDWDTTYIPISGVKIHSLRMTATIFDQTPRNR